MNGSTTLIAGCSDNASTQSLPRPSGQIVTLDLVGGLELQVRFTMPAQPAAHNAITLGPVTYRQGTDGFIRRAILQAEGQVVGQNLAENFPSAIFADARSLAAHDPIVGTLDFAAIAGGIEDGLINLRIICGAGFVTFDLSDLRMSAKGDGMRLPGYDPIITDIRIARVSPASPWSPADDRAMSGA